MPNDSVARGSAIPVGTQFSPAVVHLPAFVRAIVTHSGSKAGIETAIWKPHIRIKKKSSVPTKRNRSLPVEAAVQYGLLEKRTYNATPLTLALARIPEPQIYEDFARHILLRCGGLRVLEGIAQMQADGFEVTGDSLATYLSDQGFTVGVHNTAINSLRMWLAKAGIFPEGNRAEAWRIDLPTKSRIVGLPDEAIAVLAGLTEAQCAFVTALCRVNPAGWCLASEIRDLAEATFQVRIGRGSLPNEILIPLSEAGVLIFRSKGTKGGKSAELKTTPLFNREVLEAFVTRTILDLDATISGYYKKRPEDIYADLESSDTFKKGRALEAFAIFIMRLLGLRFVGWNKQAKETTGGGEVDAVLVGMVGAVPTRWQVQCKNTPSGKVDADHVAKEVGLLPITQATHILIIANCNITAAAREFANQVMLRSPVSIFLLDKKDFDAVKRSRVPWAHS